MDSDKEGRIEATVLVIAIGLIVILILPSIPPTSIGTAELTDLMLHPDEYQGRKLVLQGKIATWDLRSYFDVYFSPQVFGGGLGYWTKVYETRDRYAIPWVESHGWGWFELRDQDQPSMQSDALTQLYIHSDDHTGDGFFSINQTVLVSGTLMKGVVPGMDPFFSFGLYGSYWFFEANQIWAQ
jgi:hypothetical protein